MNRAWITLSSAIIAAAGLAHGQTTQTRIYSEPAGGSFYVDGTKYTTSAVFFWPKGSRHTLAADPLQISGLTTRMRLTNWVDDAALLKIGGVESFVFTADPGVTGIKATFSTEHRIDILMGGATLSQLMGQEAFPTVPCPENPTGAFTSPAPGVLFVNGVCTATSTALWAAADSTITLNAQPARGFVFEGWTTNGGPPPDNAARTYVVRGPAVLSPRFAPAKRVTIRTEPSGMQVMIDRTVIPTQALDNAPEPLYPPWELDFGDGSTHVLGAPPSQYDLSGKLWVLESFSIGGRVIGGEGTLYKAVGANIPETIVAKFVRGAQVSLLTNPAGLKLNVDGRENWPSYNFLWGIGSKHTVTAPAETTDAKGRKYKFLGWANGGPATQEVVTPEDTEQGGLRLVANYEIYPRVVVSGGQAGVRLQVDGAACSLPCTIDRPNGGTATLTLPDSLPVGVDTRLQFDSWSDGGTATRTLSFSSDRQLSFRYRTFNRLQTLSDPAEGATFRVDPGSADGFYPTDANVQVTAVANEGFKFRRWDGDLGGTNAAGFVSMQFPRVVRAQLDKVPYIPSAGIRNAAGETPVKAVAPGSIISIFGSGLANDYVAGANGPLTQTLGNVTARVGQRLLPLLFVSPEQVNAYLPSDLADGEYTVAVRNGSLPEIPGKVTVVRNAPGLFGQLIGEQFVATAQRPDGSLAAPDKPAKRGEQVVLMGTGFGPYQRPVVDGFPATDNPANPLRTPTEIVVGETVYTPDFAGAAPGLVGVTVIRFTIPADWQPGSIELMVRQAGAESNKVLLPVE